MLITVITAFDKYLAQSSKNDNINRNNSKTQPPSHHYYFLNAYYVPGPEVRCSAYIMSVKSNNNPVSKNHYLHLQVRKLRFNIYKKIA